MILTNPLDAETLPLMSCIYIYKASCAVEARIKNDALSNGLPNWLDIQSEMKYVGCSVPEEVQRSFSVRIAEYPIHFYISLSSYDILISRSR